MDGMTGFNPQQAKINIADFALNAGNACADIDEAYGLLFYELENFWASPKAVEFSDNYIPRIDGLINEMSETIKAIVKGAINGYNYVARTHDTGGWIEDVDSLINGVYGDSHGDFGTRDASGVHERGLLADKNGLVGMNIAAVRDIVMPNFNMSINKVVNALDEIPTSIALYDEEGSQQQAYESNIRGFITKFNELNEELSASMKEALETETNNILIAKQKSTESMKA